MQNHIPRTSQRAFRSASRRGATLVLIALLLPVLFIFVGFAVDLANMQRTRTELRVATDLAAKAAAATLAESGDVSQARIKGKEIAVNNDVAGDGLSLDDIDFEFGKSTQQLNGKWTFVVGGTGPNSVRINGRRTQSSPDGAVSLFFGNFIGRQTFEPTVTSAAAFLNTDICLVLDRSSSMKKALSEPGGMTTVDSRWCDKPNGSARWKDVDASVSIFLTELTATPGDEHVGMVSFGGAMDPGIDDCGGASDHSIVSIDAPLSANYPAIEAAMTYRMDSVWNGNTDIAKGLETGINVLDSARPTAQKVIILLTDGEYTEASPIPWATTAANADIKVHTITFGDSSTDPWITDMQTIANTTGGKHLHAPTQNALKNAFKELAETLSTLTE